MSRIIALCSAFVAACPLLAAPVPEPLTRAEVAKLAKPACALVEVKSVGYGSAFCIHPSGLFLTNEHVVRRLRSGDTVNIILDSGLASQKVLKARTVRSDKDLDLALLQAEDAKDLPALKLGVDDLLGELQELIAFGFPFGTALAKPGEYPAITINVVNVSSLRTDAKKELNRIQLDSNLNPGNSGCPVVDRHGKVMGVVVSGIQGAGINLAIPVRHVHRFLDRPVIVFKAPPVAKKNQHEEAEFQASATALAGDASGLDLELILALRGGEERRFPMKVADGAYRVKAVPFPARKDAPSVRVEIKYPDGSIIGAVKDRSFKVGMDTVKLSEVKLLRPAVNAHVDLADGKTLKGRLAELDTLAVQLGGQPIELRLAGMIEMTVAPTVPQNQLVCTIVARKEGKEVGRHSETLVLEGTQRATLDAIKEGKFHKPLPAAAATSYLNVVSSPGDYIGQGKTYTYEGKDLTVRGAANMIQINVDGWSINFAPPRGGALAVGEYADAKRYPFNDASPGLSFTGQGRGSNEVGGKFVIWELEMNGGQIVRLAVDFIHRSEKTGPPLVGMLRYNSMLE